MCCPVDDVGSADNAAPAPDGGGRFPEWHRIDASPRVRVEGTLPARSRNSRCPKEGGHRSARDERAVRRSRRCFDPASASGHNGLTHWSPANARLERRLRRPRPQVRSDLRWPAWLDHQENIISIQTHLTDPPETLLPGTSLFLDLDGTLLELVERPDAVVADDSLRNLIMRLAEKLEGRLAVISGRSLAQLDAILGSVAHRIAVSGSHGSEHRWRGVSAQPIRPPALDEAASRLRPFAEAHAGVLVEEKSYGVALHYRMAPAVEPEARFIVERLADELELSLQDGKMMIELRTPGGDKGAAVRRLMACAPMVGTLPVFVGDDITDEAGFVAARSLGGSGILVGSPRATAAIHRLSDPAAVRAWLTALA